MNTRTLRSFGLATALILPLLAGCSSPEPETPAASESNAAEMAPLPAPVEPEPAPLPSPTPSPTVNPEAEPIAADEQMMDDAAATGMTARSERGEAQPADTGSAAEEMEAK